MSPLNRRTWSAGRLRVPWWEVALFLKGGCLPPRQWDSSVWRGQRDSSPTHGLIPASCPGWPRTEAASLFKYFFSSFILFLSSLNCLSKFPCSSLNSVSYIAVFYDFKLDFWRTVIFFRWNSVSVVLYSTWNNCSTIAFEVNDQVRSYPFICFPVGGNITQTFCFSYLSCLWLHLRVGISQFLPSL